MGRARERKKITRVWRTMPALVPERDRRSVSTSVMVAKVSSVAAAPAAHEPRGGARSPPSRLLPGPARGGARPPPPRPTASGTSVAAAPAASRDNVSFSCPDLGFGSGRWVVTTWASPGPRPADSERPLGPRPRGKEDNKSLENNAGSGSRARPALGINNDNSTSVMS